MNFTLIILLSNILKECKCSLITCFCSEPLAVLSLGAFIYVSSPLTDKKIVRIFYNSCDLGILWAKIYEKSREINNFHRFVLLKLPIKGKWGAFELGHPWNTTYFTIFKWNWILLWHNLSPLTNLWSEMYHDVGTVPYKNSRKSPISIQSYPTSSNNFIKFLPTQKY